MALSVPLEAGTDQVLYLHLVGDTTRFGESRSIAATILPSPEWIRQQRSLLFGQGVYAGSILFVRRFLAVPEHSRNVDRVLLGVAAFTVVLYLASLTGLDFALAPVLASIGLVVTVVYAAMGLAAARRRYRPARFFLIAFAALLTGNVLYMLMFLRVLPTTFLTYNAAQAGQPSSAFCWPLLSQIG